MFGYVCIDKPELKVKDYEAYRGVYCSLCKTLGKEYSPLARFILNYDCTFLSLLVMSRSDTCPKFKSGRCFFNPLKKCNYAQKSEEALSKGAALTVITSYYKLLDGIADSGFFKRMSYRLLRPVLSAWRKKAKSKYPHYEDAVREMFVSQLKCEKNEAACLDSAAEPTAKMLEAVMRAESENESEYKVLAQMGYHLGRWIYLMDAVNDIEDDFKRGDFNPFLIKFQGIENFDPSEADAVISQSYYLLVKAYELVDKKRFTDILDNIIYNGLCKKQRLTVYPERKD